MRNTITVSIPRNPRGLMKREGKTSFIARRRVLSSLSHIHLRRAMIGSMTPFFALVCPANSSCPVQICSCYVPRGRVVRKLDPWQGEKSQVKCRSGHRYSIGQSVLTPVTGTLDSEFPDSLPRVHYATRVTKD